MPPDLEGYAAVAEEGRQSQTCTLSRRSWGTRDRAKVAAGLLLAAGAAGLLKAATARRRHITASSPREATAAEPLAISLLEDKAPPNNCSQRYDNCWLTRCCADRELRCFMKNGLWAGCKPECAPGPDPDDPIEVRSNWTCLRVLPRASTTAPPAVLGDDSSESSAPSRSQRRRPRPPWSARPPKDYPTFFCFCIIRTGTYELGLAKAQLRARASIFGCEAWAVLSDVGVELAPGIWTMVLGDLSTDNGVRTHFANTDIFTRAFDMLNDAGRGSMWKHDFVVKVDPDAVFLPGRLKGRVFAAAPKPGGKVYFRNCKFQNRVWMFGAVEVISKAAISAYYRGRDAQCRNVMDYDNMGEDTFMSRCLDTLGVKAEVDYDLLADGYCSEAPGGCSSNQVTFHPFKDVTSWMKCWNSAVR